MGKIIDLTNQTFGYLTVLNKTDKKASDRSIIWHCKCKCGNEIDVSGCLLRRGSTKSCGCYNKEVISKRQRKIIPNGTKFGKLTVIESLEEKNERGLYLYNCKCECGNIVKVDGSTLKTGNKKSCGCLYHPENLNEIGKRYGLLTIIKYTGNKNEKNCRMVLCKCDCGNEKEIPLTYLHKGTQSCGCLISKGENKISQLLKENNISFIPQYSFNDCIFETNYPAKFDFYIQNKYIIEFDGEQHFKYRDSGWNTKENFDKVKEHDRLKNKYCKEHNIPLIRIPYTHLKNICIEDLKPETSQFLVQ